MSAAREPDLTTVLLIIHLFVTLALIGVVLIQRSEGGGLGIGTSQGMGSFMSGRGTANLLTRATAILATIFMVLSLTLALLNHGTTGISGSILDTPPVSSGSPVPAPTSAPASTTGTTGSPAGSSPAGGSPPGSATNPPVSAPAGTAPAAGSAAPAIPAQPTSPPPAQGPSVPTN
jgi:preprotein translocase subunit SecG